MKLIVCGGRDYNDHESIYATLDRVHAHKPITLLIEGGAEGADYIAGCWADKHGIPHITAHPNWIYHGKAAGPIRNSTMLALAPDGVLSFPGGAGTANMVSQANRAGVKVMEVVQ